MKADAFDAKLEMYTRRFWTPQPSKAGRADILRRVRDLLLSSGSWLPVESGDRAGAAGGTGADVGGENVARLSVREERAYLELQTTLGLPPDGGGASDKNAGSRGEGTRGVGDDDGGDGDGDDGSAFGVPGVRGAAGARCKPRTEASPQANVEIQRLLPTLLQVQLRLPYPGDLLRLISRGGRRAHSSP